MIIDIQCDYGSRYVEGSAKPCQNTAQHSLISLRHGVRVPMMFCDRHLVVYKAAIVLIKDFYGEDESDPIPTIEEVVKI